MKIQTRIKQSEVRVKSGIRLVLFFAVLTVAFLVFAPEWLALSSGGIGLFFAVVTGLEYWNARRLRRQMAKQNQP